MSVLRVFLMLGALASSVTEAFAVEPEIKIEAEGYSHADAVVALETFRRYCRPLGDKFWQDVTNIEVTITQEIAQHRIARGWGHNVHLALTYSDDPQFGPAFASGTGVLAGHTLHYDLGGGETPGFLASKRSSQYLCGLPFNPRGEDIFVPVPEMKFLDRWR